MTVPSNRAREGPRITAFFGTLSALAVAIIGLLAINNANMQATSAQNLVTDNNTVAMVSETSQGDTVANQMNMINNMVAVALGDIGAATINVTAANQEVVTASSETVSGYITQNASKALTTSANGNNREGGANELILPGEAANNNINVTMAASSASINSTTAAASISTIQESVPGGAELVTNVNVVAINNNVPLTNTKETCYGAELATVLASAMLIT